MSETLRAEGITGQIEVSNGVISITRKGMRATLSQGKKGEQTIPVNNVTSVEYKKQTLLVNGHIHFLLMGERAHGHLNCPCTVIFRGHEQEVAFGRIAELVNTLIREMGKASMPEDNTQRAPETVGHQEGVAMTRQREIEEWMTQLRDGKVSIKFTIEGGSSEVLLKENEELQMMLPNMALWEARSVRTSTGGYGGPSFRVAKGVSFRLGAFGSQSSSHSELKEIDRGRLTLTNQRLVFKGAKRTSDINLAKIVSVEPYRDGIAVQVSGHEKTQCFVGIDPTKMTITATVNERAYPVPFTGLVLDCMIEGLVKKQEERRGQSSPREAGQGAVHGHDIPEQIRELGKLRDSGLITAEEFEQKKKELLDRM